MVNYKNGVYIYLRRYVRSFGRGETWPLFVGGALQKYCRLVCKIKIDPHNSGDTLP
jgi:hypothetical protein